MLTFIACFVARLFSRQYVNHIYATILALTHFRALLFLSINEKASRLSPDAFSL